MCFYQYFIVENMTSHTENKESLVNEKMSILLKRNLTELTGNNVRIGLILYRLRRRSFGGLFVLFGALSLIPGISILTGIVMTVPALQMLLGFRSPLFPRIISGREISIDRLKVIGDQAIPWIERIERLVKPRWLLFTSPPAVMSLGLVVVILAVIIAMPLPFSNILPAISLLLLALGLLERDGIMIVAGLFVAVIALLMGGLVALLAMEVFENIFKSTV
tara:strand:+ start:26573 stop:27232 length:660 start_codon:yes stop_codon:yes gene_type:complete